MWIEICDNVEDRLRSAALLQGLSPQEMARTLLDAALPDPERGARIEGFFARSREAVSRSGAQPEELAEAGRLACEEARTLAYENLATR